MKTELGGGEGEGGIEEEGDERREVSIGGLQEVSTSCAMVTASCWCSSHAAGTSVSNVPGVCSSQSEWLALSSLLL